MARRVVGEQSRFAFPLVTGLAAVALAISGMWLALIHESPVGLALWLFFSPLLAVVSAASLVAAVQQRWTARWKMVTALGVAATLSLSTIFWMGSLPDERQVPLPLFWSVGIGYLVLAGAAGSLGMTPALSRQFSPVVSRLVGLACGTAGAVIAVSATGAGLGIVLAGVAVVILTLRQWKRTGEHRPVRSV